MRTIITIMLLILISCTTISTNVSTIEQTQFDYVDSKIEPILNIFEYEARIRGYSVDRSHISITFGLIRRSKLDKNGKRDLRVGYCGKDPDGVGLAIKLYKPAWDNMNESEQEETIFHELGHCLIGREHCGYAMNRNPISIMYPHLINSSYYSKNREDLVDELFNFDSKCLRNDGHVDEVDGEIRLQQNPLSKS